MVIINGSSNPKGNTERLSLLVAEQANAKIIRLREYKISHYDYEHKNKNDDFLPLIKNIVIENDCLIFVTPVYWYAMSGLMKFFFDRITDLLTIETELGRNLRRKKMVVFTTSNGDNLGEIFFNPFVKSAEYLGMEFAGGVHTIQGKSNKQLNRLINKIYA